MARLRAVLLLTPAAYVCLLLYGCATTNPRTWTIAPPPGAAISAGMSEPDALKARQLYIWKCAKCHGLYEPAQYEEAEWDLWMKKMSDKARLSGAESKLLSQYLAAFRVRGDR